MVTGISEEETYERYLMDWGWFVRKFLTQVQVVEGFRSSSFLTRKSGMIY